MAGKTLAENLESVPDLQEGQQVIMSVDKPIKETGHLQVPSSCIDKPTELALLPVPWYDESHYRALCLFMSCRLACRDMKIWVPLQILYGNLAPEGCVAKITGKEGLVFEGPAKVYDSEEDMLAALSEDPAALKVCQLIPLGLELPRHSLKIASKSIDVLVLSMPRVQWHGARSPFLSLLSHSHAVLGGMIAC